MLKAIFVTSIIANGLLITQKVIFKKRSTGVNDLILIKPIQHKEGIEFFKKKVDGIEELSEVRNKFFFIYIWDSLSFDFLHFKNMNQMDSLSLASGKNNIDYLFVTEMDELIARSFVEKNDIQFSGCKVLGGMNDFISGIYSEKPIKGRLFRVDTTNSNCPKITDFKHKPYYLIMDYYGNILYSGFKRLVIRDQKLISYLNFIRKNSIQIKQ